MGKGVKLSNSIGGEVIAFGVGHRDAISFCNIKPICRMVRLFLKERVQTKLSGNWGHIVDVIKNPITQAA
jgi:hypothetical protein